MAIAFAAKKAPVQRQQFGKGGKGAAKVPAKKPGAVNDKSSARSALAPKKGK